MSTGRPRDQLLALAGNAASGELISVSPAAEIHVYLQRGRIAWATDSRHPFAFAAHLQDTAGIDNETFRQVVEECRRDRLPLGETLVEWGLATWEVVRGALAHQIELALSQLASLDFAQTLFLARGYVAYDDQLTFSIGDFLSPSAPLPPLAIQAPPPSQSLSAQLRATIEGVSWVEILDDDKLVEADPSTPATRVPAELLRTLRDGADFVAIRSARSSLVGLVIARARSVWCRLSADSTFGAVVSAIWSLTGAERASERAPQRPEVVTWTIGEGGDSRAGAIQAFLQRARDVLAVLVLPREGSSDPVVGCGCSQLEPERGIEIARRRGATLAHGTLPITDDTERALDSIGFSLHTMVTGEPKLWCFGAELAPDRGETLWIFIDRRHSQGLGWAYLAALTRALA